MGGHYLISQRSPWEGSTSGVNCGAVVRCSFGIVTFGSVLPRELAGMMIAAAWRPPTVGLVGSSRGIKWLSDRFARRAEPVEEIRMKRTKAQRVLAAACGPALGLLLAVPLGGLLAGAAGADTTCYTGCTTPPIGITSTPPVTPSDGASPATTASTTSTAPVSSSGLAFTGADIEEMAIIGVVAIGVGTVLVRGRRRTA